VGGKSIRPKIFLPGLDISTFSANPCVICGKQTFSAFLTPSGGEEHVCDHHETPGCKIKWQERQERLVARHQARIIPCRDESCLCEFCGRSEDLVFDLITREGRPAIRLCRGCLEDITAEAGSWAPVSVLETINA